MKLPNLRRYLAHIRIRNLYNPILKTQCYSAVDICYLLTGATTRAQAMACWKMLKQRDPNLNIYQNHNYTQHRLLLPCADGKLYMCDVIDIATVNYLITVLQQKNSHTGRWLRWVVAVLGVAGLVSRLIKCVAKWTRQLVAWFKGQGRKGCVSWQRVVKVFEITPALYA